MRLSMFCRQLCPQKTKVVLDTTYLSPRQNVVNISHIVFFGEPKRNIITLCSWYPIELPQNIYFYDLYKRKLLFKPLFIHNFTTCSAGLIIVQSLGHNTRSRSLQGSMYAGNFEFIILFLTSIRQSEIDNVCPFSSTV